MPRKLPLYDTLMTRADAGALRFHMPGHKRKGKGELDAFSLDITEIEGFDNLHHAQGILKEAQQRTAKLYGAEESFFLVNGSTVGILAAISATTEKGDKILMANAADVEKSIRKKFTSAI